MEEVHIYCLIRGNTPLLGVSPVHAYAVEQKIPGCGVEVAGPNTRGTVDDQNWTSHKHLGNPLAIGTWVWSHRRLDGWLDDNLVVALCPRSRGYLEHGGSRPGGHFWARRKLFLLLRHYINQSVIFSYTIVRGQNTLWQRAGTKELVFVLTNWLAYLIGPLI